MFSAYQDMGILETGFRLWAKIVIPSVQGLGFKFKLPDYEFIVNNRVFLVK